MTGNELANYAISKIGTPYFYGAKMQVLTEAFMAQMHKSYPGTVTNAYIAKARAKGMVGKVCCDCSGLIGAYRKKQIGSAQLYSTASQKVAISNSMPVGTVVWKKGHVGVYIGNGYVVEEKGINYGCVKTALSSTKWTYGLLFSDLEYKTGNPYPEPAITIRKGATGNGVKWLQYELNECGYGLDIDGDFGNATLRALKAFQASCKITADGICGPQTRSCLKAK